MSNSEGPYNKERLAFWCADRNGKGAILARLCEKEKVQRDDLFSEALFKASQDRTVPTYIQEKALSFSRKCGDPVAVLEREFESALPHGQIDLLQNLFYVGKYTCPEPKQLQHFLFRIAGDPRLTDNVRLQALETFNDKPDFFPPDSRITYSSPPPTDGPGEQVRNGGVYLGEFNLRNGEGTEGIVLVAIIEPMLFLDAAAVAMRITSSTGFQPVTYDDVGKPYRAGERVLNNETVIASLNMLHGANIQQCRNPELQKILTNSRWFLSSSETNQPNQVWAFNFWSNGILAQKKETHPMRAMLVRLATPSQQAATL